MTRLTVVRLRERAAQCHKHALLAHSEIIAAQLEVIAVDFEKEALQLETDVLKIQPPANQIAAAIVERRNEPATSERIDEAARRRMVIVDDDDLYREMLEQNFLDADFDVRSFDRGQPALAYLLQFPADLVLLDWKMPGLTGIDVLHQLRAAEIRTPVIMLSLLNNQLYEQTALEDGAIDFVDKSRSFSILLQRANVILGADDRKSAVSIGRNRRSSATSRPTQLELIRENNRAYWMGLEISLTAAEFKIVDLLTAQVGRDISYDDIDKAAYGAVKPEGYGPAHRRSSLRSTMRRIRRKFRNVDRSWDMIENYQDFGYRWNEKSGSPAT